MKVYVLMIVWCLVKYYGVKSKSTLYLIKTLKKLNLERSFFETAILKSDF